jgi:hypothetical protein
MWEYFVFCIFFFGSLVYLIFVLFIFPDANKNKNQDKNQNQQQDKNQNLEFNWPKLVIIGLDKNQTQFIEPLQKLWYEQTQCEAEWFHAIDKKNLTYQNELKEYPLTERFRSFLWKRRQDLLDGKCTTDYLGHLACTMSHVQVMHQYLIGKTEEKNLLIVEDDVQIAPEFFTQFPNILAGLEKLDADWDVLCLGFACGYQHDKRCQLNDASPIYEPGLVKLQFWFGGWAYLIHQTPQTTSKILSGFFQNDSTDGSQDQLLLNAQNDITLAEMAQAGKLNVYGCVPTLMNHPGQLRISSFDFTQYGDMTHYRSDTNF